MSTVLSEADLHGLVDGFLDPARRAEVLRRAATSARDRALVEAWQDQNDAIRIAFADVEREPLPAALDLRLIGPLDAAPATAPPRAGRKLAATIFVALAAGLFAAWVIVGPDIGRFVASALPGIFRLPDVALTDLPTTTIPDLSSTGFAFAGARPRADSSAGLVFTYSRGLTDRIAIDVTRVGAEKGPRSREPGGVTWTDHGVVYVISGTVAPERLHALALTLQNQPPRD